MSTTEIGIIAVVGAGIVLAFILGWRNRRYHAGAPTIMTSLGIGGTFLGVTLALFSMNMTEDSTTAELDEMVRGLINSMTTAFITSLLGLGGSVLFRWALPTPPAEEHSASTAPDEDIAQTLTGIRNAIAGESDSSLVTQLQKLRDENRDGFKQIDRRVGNTEEALAEIRTAIAGKGDTSLVTQLLKLRDENRDGFKQLGGLTEIIRDSLLKSLKDLSEELRDIIANQLKTSLEELIRKIEKALIEQFGKTFVEFNEATQALKKWQEDHRQQVEQITAAFDLTAKRISEIATSCGKIPPTLDALEASIGHTNRGVAEMNRHLEAFAELKTEAEHALPTIKKNLDRIGEDLKSAADGYSSLDDVLRKTFATVEREATRISNEHATTMATLCENVRKELKTAADAAAADVKSIVSDSTKRMNKQIDREMTAVTKARGQVVDLSEKVTADTTKAYDDMKKSLTTLFEKFSEEFTATMSTEVTNTGREWGASMVGIAQRCEEVIKATTDDRGNRA